MNTLIRGEIHKLATMRWVKIALAALIVMAPAFTLLGVFVATRDAGVDDRDFVRGVLSISAVSSLMFLGVGIASMAGEFRHGTSVPTFLITPRRRDVLIAKLVTTTVTGLGAAAGAISFGLALAVAVPALHHQGIHHLTGNTPAMWLGAAVATAAFGALGVAIGTITRNTVTAIIAAIGWSYLVEGMILSRALPSAEQVAPRRRQHGRHPDWRRHRAAASVARPRHPPGLGHGLRRRGGTLAEQPRHLTPAHDTPMGGPATRPPHRRDPVARVVALGDPRSPPPHDRRRERRTRAGGAVSRGRRGGRRGGRARPGTTPTARACHARRGRPRRGSSCGG